MSALYWALGGLAALGILYLLCLWPFGGRRLPRALQTDYAHRGLFDSQVPENSLGAFARAVEAGWGIELDVQLSADGRVVVFHDPSLLRMTGDPRRVDRLTLDELQALRLKDSAWGIPSLEQVLELVGGRVPLLIELKGESANTSLCPKLAQTLAGYTGPYCLESFNPLLIGAMKKLLPGVPRGLLYTNVCREKKKVSLLNLALTGMLLNPLARPDFIAYDTACRHSLGVRIACGVYKKPRFVWTVRTSRELARARRAGERAIFEKEALK